MDVPRHSGYPFDPTIAQRAARDRQLRRALKKESRPTRRWLGWRVGRTQ